MTLSRLEVVDLRNLRRVAIEPGADLNVIVGPNASGKTSLLEAVYLLGMGRSFRTTHVRHLIRSGAERCVVTGRVTTRTGPEIRLGVEKSKDQTRIRVAGATATSSAALAEHLPVLILTAQSHELLEAGPRLRRQFIDWGVFHVEHHYLPVWQRYTRALKQRNSLLRQGGPSEQVQLWDRSLASDAAQIDRLRASYLDELRPAVERYWERLGLEEPPDMTYRRGWSAEQELAEALRTGLERDRALGYTRLGPHRADLSIRRDGVPAHEHYSRGQQKILVAGLRMAQAQHLATRGTARCVFLVDDLPAELDEVHRRGLLAALAQTGAQLFVTATDQTLLPCPEGLVPTVFHVEHGDVRSVV